MAFMMQCAFCSESKRQKLITKNEGILCKSCGSFTYDADELGEEKQDLISRLRIGYEALQGYHFSDAKECFQNICRDHPDSAEAYWGVLLAEYGITYVKGFFDGHITPIYCFREYNPENIQYFSQNPNFLKIMQLLSNDADRKAVYRKKAEEIDEALDLFVDSESENDIDVFICVKISKASVSHPENTEKTDPDFQKAQEILRRLQGEGKRVFFSYDSLTNNPESDMEIWTNLLKSRKMLLVASKKDYIESVWVKSEWKRWLYLDANGEHNQNLYLYLLGDAQKLSRRLPEGLAGRQCYTEETEDKLIADLCESDTALLKTQAEKPKADPKEEERQKMMADLQAQIEALKKENQETRAALQRQKGKTDAREKPKNPPQNRNGKIVYTSGKTSVIPYGVKEIGNSAYEDNTHIEKVILPSSVTRIGEDAFSGCNKLKGIVIPESVKIIDKFAFYFCNSLRNVTIPGSIVNIGYGAFSECRNLFSVEIHYGVKNIGNYAFYYCSTLDSVHIPNSVTDIGEGAFSACPNLSSITIPNGVKNIGKLAFSSCRSLRSITIPNSVESIGFPLFISNDALESICIEDGNSVYHSQNNCIIQTQEKKLVCGCKNSVIPSDGSVTCIGDVAFEHCNGLRNIMIPNSIKNIGKDAFRLNENLISIEIQNGVTHIGECAFLGCTNLTNLTIPNSLIDISKGVFSGCIRLMNLEIQNGVTSIGEEAFCSCKSLTSITIPNSVTSIGKQSFARCENLKTITIPDSVTSIAPDAFKECPNLKICASKGSYAETYAREHHIRVKRKSLFW